MKKIGINRLLLISYVALSLVLFLHSGLHALEHYEAFELHNGVHMHLYTPESILEYMTERDDEGSLFMRLEDGVRYRLIEDINDPVVTHKGDGSFHPMKPAWVVQALEEIDVNGCAMSFDIEVYILPYPRYYLLASSTCGNRIFLSPGVYEVNSSVVAFTTTHEYGHAFQGKYMPDSDVDGWYQYLTIRDIYGDPTYSNHACHMNRPKEIFAEDFRYLFGGEASRYSGTIENPNLPLPDQIEGLEEFVVSLVSGEIIATDELDIPAGKEALTVSNYPNPFNPTTTIRVVFGGGDPSMLRNIDMKVYRVDGSLVRSLYRGQMRGNECAIVWDGRDNNGQDVASGAYFYRLVSGSSTVSGKMMLLR